MPRSQLFHTSTFLISLYDWKKARVQEEIVEVVSATVNIF